MIVALFPYCGPIPLLKDEMLNTFFLFVLLTFNRYIKKQILTVLVLECNAIGISSCLPRLIHPTDRLRLRPLFEIHPGN